MCQTVAGTCTSGTDTGSLSWISSTHYVEGPAGTAREEASTAEAAAISAASFDAAFSTAFLAQSMWLPFLTKTLPAPEAGIRQSKEAPQVAQAQKAACACYCGEMAVHL